MGEVPAMARDVVYTPDAPASGAPGAFAYSQAIKAAGLVFVSGQGATDPATGAEPLRMNVVVGKSLDHKTPIFVEQMEYVIFRPYWNPPHDITVNEILPHARRDPAYLSSEALEIVASGADDAAVLPETTENLDAVEAGRLQRELGSRAPARDSLDRAHHLFTALADDFPDFRDRFVP
jgi:hypothetical protein